MRTALQIEFEFNAPSMAKSRLLKSDKQDGAEESTMKMEVGEIVASVLGSVTGEDPKA
jgi:hypothetical protein